MKARILSWMHALCLIPPSDREKLNMLIWSVGLLSSMAGCAVGIPSLLLAMYLFTEDTVGPLIGVAFALVAEFFAVPLIAGGWMLMRAAVGDPSKRAQSLRIGLVVLGCAAIMCLLFYNP